MRRNRKAEVTPPRRKLSPEASQRLKDGKHKILECARTQGLNSGELMELIADRINISNAYLRVRSNQGTHGIDGRDIDVRVARETRGSHVSMRAYGGADRPTVAAKSPKPRKTRFRLTCPSQIVTPRLT